MAFKRHDNFLQSFTCHALLDEASCSISVKRVILPSSLKMILEESPNSRAANALKLHQHIFLPFNVTLRISLSFSLFLLQNLARFMGQLQMEEYRRHRVLWWKFYDPRNKSFSPKAHTTPRPTSSVPGA